MWFAILGPLLVHDGETPVDVPKGRQRALLVALLLQAGKPVSADALAEVMWDRAPPPGAEVTLRSHVLRLRRVLGTRAGARLVTCSPGYLLQVGDDEVDLLRFRCLCRDGGAAARAGAWGRAHVLLGEALDLWRGPPLADIPSESLRRGQTQDLEALRLQAEEWRIDAALHLGGHAELVPGLHLLTAQHPLRERFHGQLMLALYRCGRQAEALAVYRGARDILIAELGAEPGPELRELHQRILSADPALAVTEPTRAEQAAPQQTVPRELPSAVPGFTGRSTELRALTGLLDRPVQDAANAIVISAIGGTAGVGKTALAVHWAHQAAGHFPDGQLYVNLRGYDPAQPVPPADALAGFLRSLGVPSQDIPPEADERAARYRSLLTGRQMLVILDNARSVDQVRPLLPGTSACTVLVTSRDTLAGLVARDGATRLDLDVLPLEEAVALLRTLISARVDADPAAVAALADQCCRLPLALRVAAELAAARPSVPLSALARELADQQNRLNLLDVSGDPRTGVRGVFSWSYQQLGGATARLFRLAALHPGSDFDPYAAAALTGSTVGQARRELDELTRAHLVQRISDRLCMHDLLRDYARELTATEDSEEERHAALTRLFDYYLHTAATAMDAFYPAERHRRPRIPSPATPVPAVAEPSAARAWLDAERATLVAVTVHAAGNGWPAYATLLAATLSRYLDVGSHYSEAITVHTHARVAAHSAGDQSGEAAALNDLAGIRWQQGRYELATGQLQQALILLSQTGDRVGQAQAQGKLGNIYNEQGHCRQAADHLEQALSLAREIGDRAIECTALVNLGVLEIQQGRYAQATDFLQRALALARAIGNRYIECTALINLGTVGLRQRHHRQATEHLERALALSRETGYRRLEAWALIGIGDSCARLGRCDDAMDRLEQALTMHGEIGDRAGEADALNSLAEVFFQTGDTAQARERHAAALRIASQAGTTVVQARAHSGLARAYHADGDSTQARHHWQEALTRYTAVGAPEADEIRARLGAAADHERPR